jgi:hypothetical protein
MPMLETRITSFTTEGITFAATKGSMPKGQDYYLEIKWANDQSALDGELLKITKTTAADLAKFFTLIAEAGE